MTRMTWDIWRSATHRRKMSSHVPKTLPWGHNHHELFSQRQKQDEAKVVLDHADKQVKNRKCWAILSSSSILRLWVSYRFRFHLQHSSVEGDAADLAPSSIWTEIGSRCCSSVPRSLVDQVSPSATAAGTKFAGCFFLARCRLLCHLGNWLLFKVIPQALGEGVSWHVLWRIVQSVQSVQSPLSQKPFNGVASQGSELHDLTEWRTKSHLSTVDSSQLINSSPVQQQKTWKKSESQNWLDELSWIET